MEKEFVPYEQALALKELGFDEHCFGYYLDKKLNIFHSTSANDRINSKTIEIFSSDVITSPTFSQAFRWFREKYGVNLTICPNTYNLGFYSLLHRTLETGKREFIENPDSFGELSHYHYETYEEAELECLKELIEIVKEKK